jgi:hypothetical protein
MKRIIFLTFLLFLSGYQLFSQTSAPVLKSGVSTTIFDSAEGGFKIDFPFQPTRTVRTVKGAYGETPTVNFQALGEESGFVVAYTDLPSLLKEKVEIEAQLDGIKLRFSGLKNGRLLKESEIKIGDNFAKEYVFETDEMTIFTRGLIVGQRFFQVSFMTQTALSKLKDSEKKIVEARASEFLDSFAITKLPVFVDKSKKMPEDFGVTVEGTTFKSKYLKLEMEIPENWYYLEDWDSNSVTELIKDEIDSSDSKIKESYDYSIKNTKLLLIASKEDFGSDKATALITLAVEKVPFPDTLPEATVKYYQDTSLEKNEKVTKPVSTSVFGGRKFAWIEYFNADDKTTNRFYAVNIDGLMFEIGISFQNQSDLKKILA